METIILIIHTIVSLFLIGVVLLQAGKGASIGATFGGGNQAIFGSSQGSTMGKITGAAATIFMLTSLSLAYISAGSSSSSIMKSVEIQPPAAEMPMDSAPAELPDFLKEGGEAAPEAPANQ